jgi:hypothetical protein
MKLQRNLIMALLVGVCMASQAGAALIQHLDASAAESLVLWDGTVSEWRDLSGNDNHAIANRGSVLYPSTPLAGGDVAVDCGFERNDLQLFDEAGTSALLDFSGAAAGNSGFTVLISLRLDMMTDQDQNILGTRNTNGHFNFSLDMPAGEIRGKVNNNINTGVNAAAGDTLVLAISYEAATGATWLYESKTGSITNSTKPANGDFDNNGTFTLGEAKPTVNSSDFFRGAFGEVMIFNEYLDTTAAEPYIAELVYQWVTPMADKLNPGALVPADGSQKIPIDGVTLSWIAGLNSVNQNVYFGTDADAVANATPENPMDAYMSTQTGTSYSLPTLAYGTTYYYRIESVNGEIYSSDVFTFDTVKYAYPLDPDYITATASSTAGALDPNVSCNGAGLDPNDEHGTGFNSMWISNPEDGAVWIQYDFEASVKLHEILIWNHNSEIEDIMGWGIKDASLEYTVDGQAWQTLTEVVLEQGTGMDQYAANNSIPVGDLTVKGVRINVLSNYSSILPNMYGLSEVQFLVVPLLAADPVPTNGQTGVSLDPVLSTLSWAEGRGAVSHALYVSTDMDAVLNETIAPITLMDATYEMPVLDVNTVYYWKVNETTGAEVWTGNLWDFTTVATVLLDDMEAYGAEENVIYATWIDGYETPDQNGALVGADPYLGDGDPFTPGDGSYDPEIIVIQSGRQSLPIWFDNSVAPTSEVTRSLAGAEIPDVGARKMILSYQFGTDSVGDELYVEINGVEAGSAAIPTTILPLWSEISIDLAVAGIDDATQVTSVTIGIRGANAKGVVYVDDVSLTN